MSFGRSTFGRFPFGRTKTAAVSGSGSIVAVDACSVGHSVAAGVIGATVGVEASSSGVPVESVLPATVSVATGVSESSAIAVGEGAAVIGVAGSDGVSVATSFGSVVIGSIGAVQASAVASSIVSGSPGAIAGVAGTSRAASVVSGSVAWLSSVAGRSATVAVGSVARASVLSAAGASESQSVAVGAVGGVFAASGASSVSLSVARGDGDTSVTANYPVSMDMTAVQPDLWMVLVPLETTTAAVSVYGDDATVPQEVTTVTVQADDAVPVPVDTWKATA